MAQLYNFFNVNFRGYPLEAIAVLQSWNPSANIKDVMWETMLPL